MAAGQEDVADTEPFSPSDFLDLPATPGADGGGQDKDDDLVVLPFISRMLMEDDIDDELLYQQNPDHRALLQAQQTFAEILSGAGAASTSTSTTKSAAGNTTLPPPCPSSSAATCPYDYDPVDLLPRVDMEMLNRAFLKGMEEANKFLPINSSKQLVTMADAEATSGDEHHQAMEKASMFQAGRHRKNRQDTMNWDDELEAEMGRSSKLMMAPADPEEGGEMVDECIQKGYQSLLDRMMSMSIGSEDDTRKQQGRLSAGSSNNEAVDLRTLLLHCAQAMASGGAAADEQLREIKRRSSPRGDATQRLAHYLAQALEARLAGTGSQQVLYRSPSSLVTAAKRASAVELLASYQLYLAVCCFKMMAFKFSNMTICKAIRNGNSSRKKKKVHIVDYGGERYGFQWPTLLGALAAWEGGPPEVRITALDLPLPGFRPPARLDETGRRLADFARRCGVPFSFRSVAARWETVGARDLDLEPDDEVLVVNGLFYFGRLMDEGVEEADIDSPSPRDVVLCNIAEMKPDVFILCVENSSSCSAPFFATRFREALFYYAAMFDMMDAVAPRDSRERLTVEQELFACCAMNVVACEGSDRVERPEGYRQWQARNQRARLRQLPLDADVVEAVRYKVKNCYHKDFVVDVDHQWLLQGWKGRILYAMSTWVSSCT